MKIPRAYSRNGLNHRDYQAPIYVTRNSSGPDHSKIFEVDVVVNGEIYGSGSGHSKQTAAKAAAAKALDQIGMVDRIQTNEG